MNILAILSGFHEIKPKLGIDASKDCNMFAHPALYWRCVPSFTSAFLFSKEMEPTSSLHKGLNTYSIFLDHGSSFRP